MKRLLLLVFMFVLYHRFALDQVVLTPWGNTGIVSMVGCNDGGVIYKVKTLAGEMWFKEAQLREN